MLLREIFTNISYSIVVSVFCIAILLIAYLDIGTGIFLKIFSFIVYFLVIQFLLTMFMVLKRVHVLLSIPFLRPVLPKPQPAPPSLRKGTRRRRARACHSAKRERRVHGPPLSCFLSGAGL